MYCCMAIATDEFFQSPNDWPKNRVNSANLIKGNSIFSDYCLHSNYRTIITPIVC